MIKCRNEIEWGLLYAVINLLAVLIYNRRPQRNAVLTRLEILAWSFLSIYLSPICLPICLCFASKFQYSSHTNANSLTRSLTASIWTTARNQHLFISFFLCHFSLLYRIFPLQLFAALRSHPIWVARQGSQVMCPVVNCSEVEATIWKSVLTRPLIEY